MPVVFPEWYTEQFTVGATEAAYANIVRAITPHGRYTLTGQGPPEGTVEWWKVFSMQVTATTAAGAYREGMLMALVGFPGRSRHMVQLASGVLLGLDGVQFNSEQGFLVSNGCGWMSWTGLIDTDNVQLKILFQRVSA